jgi:hypothetical protein
MHYSRHNENRKQYAMYLLLLVSCEWGQFHNNKQKTIYNSHASISISLKFKHTFVAFNFRSSGGHKCFVVINEIILNCLTYSIKSSKYIFFLHDSRCLLLAIDRVQFKCFSDFWKATKSAKTETTSLPINISVVRHVTCFQKQ